jgi:hypothetical protein
MITTERALQSLSDEELLRELTGMLRQSRRTEASLVAHLGEVDARRLYAREACPSMYVYCTRELGLSEPEAYLRITAARASRQFPELLAMLADGRMHLSGIALLAPHLTAENRESVLKRAAGKSKRQIEELVAELSPRPDVRAAIRRLPERTARRRVVAPGVLTAGGSLSLARSVAAPGEEAGTRPADGELRADRVDPIDVQLRPDGVGEADMGPSRTTPSGGPVSKRVRTIEPLAPDRYKVQFTASTALREKLAQLQMLMRSSVPDGDLAAIIEAAVTEKIEQLEARRFGAAKRPRTKAASSVLHPKSRHIPAAVRRAVRARDGDRCCYRDRQGTRCTARHRLEFHHRHPYGFGGSHSVENLCLMCRTHNRYIAEIDYGPTSDEAGRSAGRGTSTGPGPEASRRPQEPATRKKPPLQPGRTRTDVAHAGRSASV